VRPPVAPAPEPAAGPPPDPEARSDRTARLRAITVSLVVGSALLVAKFWAYRVTGSQTVFSDAMESIVNVAAALVALLAIVFASRPADRNHPYGHGKAEFLTAAFEGGLVAFAAIVIVHEAVSALLEGRVPQRLETGIFVVAGAGAANLALGGYLARTGRRHGSPALVADGHHVMSDFWTSAGAVVGLVAVHVTRAAWLDPVVAIAVALVLLRTGARLVREAMRGLLDEVDPEVVQDVAGALEGARRPGAIEVHDLRAINVGGYHHVDLHVVVPEFWTVERSHAEMDAFERRVKPLRRRPGELQFHVDPCERAYCARCDYPDCPVREAAFERRRPFTTESVVAPPRPVRGGAIHEDPNPRPTGT
jgi:cation diffusion facilitator family transporter